MNAEGLRRIQFLDVHRSESVTHGQVNRFPSLLIQFPQVRQAHAADVELTHGRLPNRETRNPQVVVALSVATQEACGHQVLEKTMDRADRESRKAGDLLGGKSARGFAEKMQKPQPALQSCDVVSTLWTASHVDFFRCRNESANYLMKSVFLQQASWG
jgi:hypothetical protein